MRPSRLDAPRRRSARNDLAARATSCLQTPIAACRSSAAISRRASFVLLAMVGVLLAITCGNVASLLVARAERTRARDCCTHRAGRRPLARGSAAADRDDAAVGDRAARSACSPPPGDAICCSSMFTGGAANIDLDITLRLARARSSRRADDDLRVAGRASCRRCAARGSRRPTRSRRRRARSDTLAGAAARWSASRWSPRRWRSAC